MKPVVLVSWKEEVKSSLWHQKKLNKQTLAGAAALKGNPSAQMVGSRYTKKHIIWEYHDTNPLRGFSPHSFSSFTHQIVVMIVREAIHHSIVSCFVLFVLMCRNERVNI